MLNERIKRILLSVSDTRERAYRKAIIEDIERKIATQGEHTAQPHKDRARQFMPFAALKGYAEMVQEEEKKH